jgi:hypothetical protein
MGTRQLMSSFQEIADFLATGPSKEEVLRFRPSRALQRQAQKLLAKQDGGQPLSEDEECQLDELLKAELLMRLLKAKLRTRKDKPA